MLPKKIRKNKGCRKCAHKGVNRENCRSVEEVRELAKSKGFELISSPNPESIARLEKITLNCSKHGEFTVLLGSLIDRPKVCRACGYGEVRRKMLIPDEILTSMASEVKSQFVKSGVRNNKRRFVLLNCPDHG
jgi:predicted Zn-ribbon and HTH transcriptional regulator